MQSCVLVMCNRTRIEGYVLVYCRSVVRSYTKAGLSVKLGNH